MIVFKRLNLLFLPFLIVLLSCSDAKEETPALKPEEGKRLIRLGSYNLLYGKSNTETKSFSDANTQQIAEVIDAMNMDIVALQELDSGFVDRQNKRFFLRDVQQKSKKDYALYYGPAHSFQNGTANVGVGVLVDKKFKVLHTKQVALPGEENRTLLMLELPDFWFIATHFDLNDQYRVESSEIILEEIKKLNKPVYLAGDLNMSDNNNVAFNKLKRTFDILTPKNMGSFVGSEATIDYILYSENGTNRKVDPQGTGVFTEIMVNGKNVDLSKVSDHYPVWLNISN